MNQSESAIRLKKVRQQEIYELMKLKRSVTVDYLAKTLYASPTTIRRDLEILEKNGLISRIHGGAIIAESYSSEIAQTFRETLNSDKKQLIASLVEQFLRNNQTIFLDGSTTNRFLIPIFKKFSNIIFITNSFKTVNELVELPDSEIYLAGGKVIKNFNHTSGYLTVDYLNNFRSEIGIIACKGISATSGCSVVNLDQSIIKRTMIKNAKTRILLCDSSKFDKVYLFHFADFRDFDYLITDQLPSEDLRNAIESSGCKIITKRED